MTKELFLEKIEKIKELFSKTTNSFWISFNRYAWPGFVFSILVVYIDLIINGYQKTDILVQRFDWLIFFVGLTVALFTLVWLNRKETWFTKRVKYLERLHEGSLSTTKGKNYMLDSARIDINIGHNSGILLYVSTYSIIYVISFTSGLPLWIPVCTLIMLTFLSNMKADYICFLCASDLNAEIQFIKNCLMDVEDCKYQNPEDYNPQHYD